MNDQVLSATEAVLEGDESEYSDIESLIDWDEIDISYKFGHQMALVALVTNFVTRWRHLH